MTIPPEAKELLEKEQAILDDVLASLKGQIKRGADKYASESKRSRSLTSEIVAARRVEDKAMLASDEAVSHGIKEQKQDEITGLLKIVTKPYFARLVVEEEVNGVNKEFEYKIGFAANTDCRIIDWRKAPISKLYYEYKENDEYSEEIQGRERTGRVALRNTIDIEKEHLRKVICRYGSFTKSGSDWLSLGSAGSKAHSNNTLPNILSLITPDQFRMITEEASTAILIQGIAGSGKTTVALHRLAWLLHEDNSDLKSNQCAVIVFSKALKRFISGTLPSIDVNGVEVLTFQEWAARCVALSAPHLLLNPSTFKRPIDQASSSVARVKRSLALLRVVENEALLAVNGKLTIEQIIIRALEKTEKIIELDESRLIDKEIVQAALNRAKQNQTENVVDTCDDALFVRVTQILNRGVAMSWGAYGYYGHLVADEVQDMSSAELACVIGAVKDSNKLTLVGDTAQKVNQSSSFPGWEKLQQTCSLKDSMSKYISLSVSHRSTLQIMKFADYIQGRTLVTEGRTGKPPIWFRCRNENQGVEAVIKWLNRALDAHPAALTAVICATHAEAKIALSLLKPTFGSGVRMGDEDSFSFDEGLVVTDAAQVKGLEFMSVLIWNPSVRSYPNEQHSRNLLYIAATRAQENLCLVTWEKASALLPPANSNLIRNRDLISEPNE